jgi:ABC-2 type transport system permease protein/sodium transport system permease protein
MSKESFLSRVGLLHRLVRKELNEILRDRRTILTLVLMPLLLYPLLAVAFRTFLLTNLAPSEAMIYRIGVHPGREGNAIHEYLHAGEGALRERESADQGDAEAAPNAPVPPHRQPPPELEFVSEEDLEDSVFHGRLDVAIRARPPGRTTNRPGELALDWELLYRSDSSAGLEAARYLERVCMAANNRFLATRLHWLHVRQRESPVSLRPIALPGPQQRGPAWLPGLVPLILILMTITGAVYPAIDLTAGERERGTLEILAAAPVPRLSVLFAKYVAVFAVATLTALINLGTMTVTLYVSGVGEALFGVGGLSPLVFVQVLGLLLLFAAFFSAMLLVLTSFARSFKEAQSYLIPLMLLALMPGVLSLMPGLQLQGPLSIAPLINIALLTRDLLEGKADAATAAVVVATTLLYALAALAVAARVFAAEAVLYSQPGGWADLFRRPREPRGSAPPSAALLCVALLFPSSFLAHGLLARLTGESFGETLLGMALVNVLLFGGFPLASAWLGRVRLSSALRLARPNGPSCLAGLLLGLSLWPWTHEIHLILREAGIATLNQEQLRRMGDALMNWREVSPVLILLAMAVLPAVVEELFFRGYLLSALLGVLRPWQAIGSAAALFALFHVILSGMLAVERFVPSLLLGVVLGWVCWKTGSVWPGVLLHALHNGCVVMLAYYGPRLAELGWSVSEEGHLPIPLLAAAALGALAGAVGIAWFGSGFSRAAVSAAPDAVEPGLARDDSAHA